MRLGRDFAFLGRRACIRSARFHSTIGLGRTEHFFSVFLQEGRMVSKIPLHDEAGLVYLISYHQLILVTLLCLTLCIVNRPTRPQFSRHSCSILRLFLVILVILNNHSTGPPPSWLGFSLRLHWLLVLYTGAGSWFFRRWWRCFRKRRIIVRVVLPLHMYDCLYASQHCRLAHSRLRLGCRLLPRLLLGLLSSLNCQLLLPLFLFPLPAFKFPPLGCFLLLSRLCEVRLLNPLVTLLWGFGSRSL